MLNINKQAENGKLVIALEGRLDTTTSPVLEVELKSWSISLLPVCVCCFQPRRR